jgi:hypothetical protein
MRLASLKPTIAFCILTVHSVAFASDQSDDRVAGELRGICQQLIDAVAPGHADVWRRYLDDRVIHVDENGTVRTKEELLAELTPLPAGLVGRATIDRFKAEVFGDVAVVAYELQEHLDYHGQILRSRFRTSDTWRKTPDGWRLIAEQVAAVEKDPPAMTTSLEQRCRYNGAYALTEKIRMSVRCSATGLTMERTGRPAVEYLPETPDVFFTPGQPRTRRIFVRDETGKIVALVDRREGEDIRWSKEP